MGIILTEEGYKKLVTELDYLVKTKSKEIGELIEKSNPDSGDWKKAKEELKEIESRIADIKDILKTATVLM